MLYIMHLPWGWIKQRPHFLAEYLNRYYQVSVFCRKFYKRKWLVDNAMQQAIDVHEFYRLPLARYRLFEIINDCLANLQLQRQMKDVDICWITYPTWYPMLRSILPNEAFLIYDCMDDALEFPTSKLHASNMKRLVTSERALIKRANMVFASSVYLKEKLIQRYNISKNIHVVNNAVYLDDAVLASEIELPKTGSKYAMQVNKILMYIGTISEWMDIALILESLSKHSNIIYYLVGPVDIELPVHERLIHIPPVAHCDIYSYMQKADALILPFEVTELVKSVNPVKIYEYIYSGKPIIAAAYDETRFFHEYVYTYNYREEYDRYLDLLVSDALTAKKNEEDCKSFAMQNTWAERTNMMHALIDQAYQNRQTQG